MRHLIGLGSLIRVVLVGTEHDVWIEPVIERQWLAWCAVVGKVPFRGHNSGDGGQRNDCEVVQKSSPGLLVFHATRLLRRNPRRNWARGFLRPPPAWPRSERLGRTGSCGASPPQCHRQTHSRARRASTQSNPCSYVQ